MLTEEELKRDYNLKRAQLEEQEDTIRRGEVSFNQKVPIRRLKMKSFRYLI
ncbi:hypothetical protein LACDD01_02144 [Lactococcus sp. DD01]|nr:hypothetical protein LACDD01_02144 [Lactococcus sp. DD01]